MDEQEASLSLPEQIRGARASLSGMSDAGRALLVPLKPKFAALNPDELFEFVSDRTIAGLVDLVGAGR